MYLVAVYKGCPHITREGLAMMETNTDRWKGLLSIKRTSFIEKVCLNEKTAFTSRFNILKSILNREFFMVCFCLGMFSVF